ncbi:response regulator transcription factor [Hymenobacter gummosus]|uniref:Response regulator transcription factor n=1 Tax=Hymenobacter gummosus TaxID=1776032 RepID=A0A3S0H219_9BACT|nr:response regulator transcription factor [Hymenobacter gummosus]RTQ46333.1 response regulator transcription factor [Hymenobacter gummosus]
MTEPFPEAIQVLLVDDHPLVIEGIQALLRDASDIRVAATASSGYEALQRLQEQPGLQVAIVDLNMPGMNGVELLRAMLQQHPQVRAMALSVYYDYSSVTDVLEAGGSGYLLKNTSKKELVEAVREVYAGHNYFSPEVGATLLQHLPRAGARPSPAADAREDRPVELTAREKEVLQLIAREIPSSRIAEQLFISERTVESHRKNLLTKTNSKSVVGLIQYALRHKLIN